ncbi:MAG: bifunctional diaminohydroxyphosphoribosylaminopyrimidine deaminase/5-amino-6-(5-phosphoribosylamino)uracil reductase RibD [Alphaproteobacteria bacterium]|nr:bifunctional diaminohydroxyphosphoribosylaminopyrimidine deaminase/5-amino-6-(5-phosphoribosylamino)uracil reductase RibD [Alphaproteobacteria bacterium]
MKLALALARRGLGTVSPNPAVGCVLVSPDGIVVGRGWTQPGGRPHAETEALRRAGARARGATAYVTLEPCSHTGRTPPCADALIEAGVVRVVGAIEDPDPRVSGQGFARLAAAGIEVSTNLFANEAAEVNAGFLLHRIEGRPLVTLKAASTLDGRIATHRGESQWITGAAARRCGHLMRMTHDAIVVGIGTALVDDPELTCRLPGLEEHSPVRVVIDTRLQLPLVSKLVRTAREMPTWVAVSAETEADRCAAYEDLGVVVLPIEVGGDHHPEPIAILKALGARGLTRVLVEGGSAVAAALMRANLVDRMAWFRAASVMGGDGTPVVAAYGVDALSQMRRFELISSQSMGDDRLETYRVAH